MAENKEKNMTSKYRMVKHFGNIASNFFLELKYIWLILIATIDRKKVERAIKKVQKQLNETRTFREKTELEKKLYELQIDFNYILVGQPKKKEIFLQPFLTMNLPIVLPKESQVFGTSSNKWGRWWKNDIEKKWN